ncbi:MAG: response regulator transcription factor [Anaerotignum sp.]|nr:response regulator transcription factor [Anaerotignum sp.]
MELKYEGYDVTVCHDGREGMQQITDGDYDMILLDLMLPGLTGIEICRRVRKFSQVPIIMVTAKGEDMDKIMGLEYGADDYITKPFNILELKARIKAILRRSVKKASAEAEVKNALKARDLELAYDSRRVFVNGREVNLTAKEFDLLELLMENPGKVYSRDKLLDTIWGFDYPGDARTVDVHVRRLREKIEENPSEPKYIFTKWGVGYYFN